MGFARDVIRGTFSRSTSGGGVGHASSILRVHVSARPFIRRYFFERAFSAERSPELPLQGGDMKTTSGARSP
ncbi:MAG: hypothetical protein SangKO_075290 [Sandaracinaceae bacterium]